MSLLDKLTLNDIKYLLTGNQDMLEKNVTFGNGRNLNTGKKGKVVINDSTRSGHFCCFGTTGVGKTRLLENMVEEDIRKGYNVVVFDTKGDCELFSKIVQVVLETDRKDDLMFFSNMYPKYSIQNELLKYGYTDQEITVRVNNNEIIKRLTNGLHLGSERKSNGVILVIQDIFSMNVNAGTLSNDFVVMLTQLADDVSSSIRKLPTPLCLYLDEAENVLSCFQDNLLNKLGDVDIWVHCFSQSINKIYDKMPSKEVGNAIVYSMNTKVFMRIPNFETAEDVVKCFFGNKKNDKKMVITPQQILELQPREFFMISLNRMYRGTVSDVSNLILSVELPEKTL